MRSSKVNGTFSLVISLSKMEKDGLIRFIREEEKRKIYHITELGKIFLQKEISRIERLYQNSKGVVTHAKPIEVL